MNMKMQHNKIAYGRFQIVHMQFVYGFAYKPAVLLTGGFSLLKVSIISQKTEYEIVANEEKRQSNSKKNAIILVGIIVVVGAFCGCVGILVVRLFGSDVSEKKDIWSSIAESDMLSETNQASGIENAADVRSEARIDDDNSEVTTEHVYCPSKTKCYYFNGHTYAQFDYKEKNLPESYKAWEVYCESLGGHLATIGSEEENAAIYSAIQEEGLTLAFFGYSDEKNEGNWQWVTGEESSYTNWEAGQPNNGANDKKGRSQNYAQFSKKTADGQWDDAGIADNSWHFICEWDQIVKQEK